MAKNNNGIWWILGIVLIVILAYYSSQLKFPFSILTTQTCVDNVISDWEFNGNVLDEKGMNNGVNFGGTFSSGTINFNGTTYMNLPAIFGDVIEIVKYPTDTNFIFLSKIGASNYVNGIQDNTRPIIPLGNLMGNGTNVSIDRIVVFSNLSVQTMQSLYNNGTYGNICWTTTTIINVSCSEYATSQIPNNSSGSLMTNDGIYPNCTFIWKEPQYKIANNLCSKNFLYQSSCLAPNCYSSLSSCNLVLTPANTTATSTITASIVPPEQKTENPLNKEIFNLFGYSVTAIHLLIVLMLIIGVLYFINKK